MNQEITVEESRQFDMLCDNKELFAIAVGNALIQFSIENGLDATIEKQAWYAQIADAIIKGDVSTVTNVEKSEFLKLHLKLMGY